MGMFNDSAIARTRGRLVGSWRLVGLGLFALAVLLLPLFGPTSAAAVEELHIGSRFPGDVPHHNFWTGSAFTGWQVIGGKTIVSPPALVSYEKSVHLFAVSNDGHLYQAIWDNTKWNGWFDFGGPFSALGAAAVDYFGYLLLFVVGNDDKLYYTYFDPNSRQWQNYTVLAENIAGRPAAAVLDGRLHLVLKGFDDHYYYEFYPDQNNQLSGFFDIGSPFKYGAALATFQGQVHLFGPGFDGHLYQGTLVNGQWQGYFDLGQPSQSLAIDSSAAAAGYAGIAIIVLARANDDGLYGRVFSGGSWGAWSSRFGDALTGPGITSHQNSGGGGGQNHPPTLGSVVATRLVHSFGREDSLRFEGILGRPGVAGLQALVAPAVITLSGTPNPIVTAASALMDCCTLLVAEGAADPDGNPVIFQWQAVTGTFYSTGSIGSGGVPFGGKITDVSTYTRNSIFWEAPSIGFPLVHHDLMGGLTNVGAKVVDIPTVGPPLSSDVKFVALEWDRTIHLELSALAGHRLPPNDPDFPDGVEVEILATVTGNSQNVGTNPGATIRVDCGNRKGTIRNVPFIPGTPVRCPYEKDEENSNVTVGAVVTSGGTFISPPDGPKLDLWKSRGCTVGTTESIPVKVTDSQCNDQTFPGGDTPETHQVEMGTTAGTFQFDWDTASQKDRIVVSYQGSTLFDSGCVGSSGTEQLNFSGNSTKIQVQVFPNCENPNLTGTVWQFTVHCPK
jgi:hypothetical protein